MGELTHCKRGHEFTPENSIYYKGNGRTCRTCRKLTRDRRRAERPMTPEQWREQYRRSGADTPKRRARWAVRRALSRGQIARPDSCGSCGATGPVAGHHDDYDKPLDVRWLCRPCHENVHRELRHVA